MSRQMMTEALEFQILSLYDEGRSSQEILDLLPVTFKTTKTVHDVLRKHEVSSRTRADYKYSRDSAFFDRIDSKEKAYLLGLMITDGWIAADNSIGFSSIDKEATDLFPKFLQTENGRGVTEISGGQQEIFGQLRHRQTSWQFQIKDGHLKQALVNLGFLNPKSFLKCYLILTET